MLKSPDSFKWLTFIKGPLSWKIMTMYIDTFSSGDFT
jgi:hypothetical protein